MPTVSIRLDEKTNKRMEALAAKTGRTKTFYVREAVLEHLEELEDVFLADKRLKDIQGGRVKTIPLADVERDLGMEG